MSKRKAIAIDFDGCLCENAWPEIGDPHMDVIRAAIREQGNGAALILWTCRVGAALEAAVDWCSSYGLEFDAVNANLPERITEYRNDCRKVNADEYWDDRAVRVPLPTSAPLTLEELRQMDEEPVWCCQYGWKICYGIVEDEGGAKMLTGCGGSLSLKGYGHGKTWLAYRRKPEW